MDVYGCIIWTQHLTSGVPRDPAGAVRGELRMGLCHAGCAGGLSLAGAGAGLSSEQT